MDRMPYLASACAVFCAFAVHNAGAQVPFPAAAIPVEAGKPMKAELVPHPKDAPTFTREPAPNPSYLADHNEITSPPPSAVFNRSPMLAPIAGPCDCCASCACGPTWQVRASALALTRSSPNSTTLVSFPAGTNVLNASQLSFDYEVGFDVSVRGALSRSSELEVRYFSVDNLNASTTFTLPAGTGQFGTNPPTNLNLDLPVNTVAVRYQTELHSGEINYWQRLSSNWKWAAGFRMLEVNENLSFNFNDAAAVASWDVNNRLYGFQLGAEGTIWQYGNLYLEGVIKAGIYGNRADQTAKAEEPPGTVLAVVQAKNTNAAFVGEAGLTGMYRVTRNIALRAGYQVLWVDGVSLASEQVSATGNLGLPNPASRIDSSNVFFHGGSVGVEFRW